MPNDAVLVPSSPRVVELDEIDSTNLEALRRAVAGERGPMWIAANRQTAGRGRLGRSWQSPAGNFAATLLIAPECPPSRLHEIALVAGIAVHGAVKRSVGDAVGLENLRLKWPNDLLFQGAKLGGILVESSSAGTAVVAAIGIGINIVAGPIIDGRATTCLGAMGKQPSIPQLLAALDAELGVWLGRWENGAGFAAIRSAWLERAGPLGERVSINTGTEIITGEFAGIDETGALLVASVAPTPRETRRFTFGDVSLLLPPRDQG